MSQTPLLPIALVCAASFVTLGCLRPHPSPHYVHQPEAVEEEASPARSSSKGTRSSGRGTSEAAPPPKVIPTSIEVHSDCSKSVPVFFGDGKPGFSSGRKSSISSNTISTEGRKPDGSLTIWIIDEHENGISNVKLTADDKRVTVNSDCKSFRAE